VKVLSYTGPYQDTTADCPTLDINVGMDSEEKGLDPVHYGAIQIHGDELILTALDFLKFIGVPQK
jgi:hypothetical protein